MGVCSIWRRPSLSSLPSSGSSGSSPLLPSHSHFLRSRHLAACVALAAGAGVTASANPPFLYSLRGAPVGAGTALPDPPCGKERPQVSVILGTLLACADRGFLSLLCLHRAHSGLLQTAAILFVPLWLVCLPLLHADPASGVGASAALLVCANPTGAS